MGSEATAKKAWAGAGVSVVESARSRQCQVVVAGARDVSRALAFEPAALIMRGGRSQSRRLERLGWRSRIWWAAADPLRPSLLATPDDHVVGYVLSTNHLPSDRLGLANRRARLSGRIGTLGNVVVATRAASAPWPLPVGAAVGADLVEAPAGVALVLGTGNDHQRPTALCFPAGSKSPAAAIKWTRARDFDRGVGAEEVVMAHLVTEPDLAEHLPTPLGRLELPYGSAIVQRAAAGASLNAFARSRGSSAAMRIGESVVDWLCEVARRTRAASAMVDPTQGVQFSEAEADRLRSRLDGVPAVVAHNDLGSVNVLTDGHTFSVIDWEDATLAGLPVVDAAYFATDLLATLAAPNDAVGRARWCCALWRGELPQSSIAAAWVQRAGQAVGLSRDAIGALVVAAWVMAAHTDRDCAHIAGEGTLDLGYYPGFVAEMWRADPKLGLMWRLP